MPDDPEAELRARITTAMDAIPAPDRVRLARIEQRLRTDRRGHWAVGRWLAAALLGSLTAGAGATYWLGADAPTTPPNTAQPEHHSDASSRATDSTDAESAPADSTGGNDDGERRDTPVIYQR